MPGTSPGMTEKRDPLNDFKPTAIDETSARYEGWRIVVVCFLVATFGWGLGFYGQSVYVAELHRLHGWPTSLISSGTTFFYLFGALLVAFVSEAIKAIGPRNCLLVGVFTMAGAAVLIGRVTEPWQLYVANALLAFGWAGTSLGIITNTLGLWFDKKRGMAISLALNGASFGGIIGVPLLVGAIGYFGFPGAMIAAAIALVVVMVPVMLMFVGRPPLHPSAAVAALSADAPSATRVRAQAFRDIGFLSVSASFALVLFAQVGFIVHLIAFLDSVVGRERAAFAVALMTAMAVVGRVLFSFVIDRLNQRLASSISFVSQAAALARHHQRAQRFRADRGLRAVRLLGRQSDHAAGADRAARIRPALVRRLDQPDHGDQPGHLRVRPRRHRLAARCLGELCAAVLHVHRAGTDRRGADHDSRATKGVDEIVIASEAKQSSFRARKLDCFVASAPRNDVERIMFPAAATAPPDRAAW